MNYKIPVLDADRSIQQSSQVKINTIVPVMMQNIFWPIVMVYIIAQYPQRGKKQNKISSCTLLIKYSMSNCNLLHKMPNWMHHYIFNLNECEWWVHSIHRTHMYSTVKQTENTFLEETPAFQEAITLFVPIQRSTACLGLSGRTSALHELHSCVLADSHVTLCSWVSQVYKDTIALTVQSLLCDE